MAIEVSTPYYTFLPSEEKLESHFNEVTKGNSAEANNNAILGDGLSPTKTISTPLGKGSTSREINSTPTNSTPTKSTPTPTESTSTPTKSTSTPTKNISSPTKSAPIPTKSNSSPAKSDSPIGNDQLVSNNPSTPPKNVSTPVQNSPVEIKTSPGMVGNSDPPEPSHFPVFHANYIHDLESIWWILLWVILNFEKAGQEEYTEEYKEEIKERVDAAARLFHTGSDCSGRKSILEWKPAFKGLMSKISSSFDGLAQVTITFKKKMISTYKKEEGRINFPIKLRDGGVLHQVILEAFRTSPIEYFDVVHVDDIHLTTSEESSGSTKRSISEDNEDSEEERPSKRAR